MINRKYIRRAIFKRLKKSDLIYTLTFLYNCRRDLICNYKEMKKWEIKSKDVVKQELDMCKKYWHCHVWYYYIHYELYNKLLTKEALLDYVPPFYFANQHQEKFQKGIDVVKLSNKLEQFYLFRERGIETPNVLYVIKNNKIYNLDGEVIDLKTLDDYTFHQKLFVKPCGNCGGFGISVVHSLKELNEYLKSYSSKDIYVVQKKIEQRTDLDAINSSCVNTLRVIVHETLDHKMEMKICILRMGRNNSDVDNSAQGGISIVVDVANGRFTDYATAEHGGGKFYTHPDSKFKFSGQGINDWQEVKCQIEETATKLVDLHDIALDVALTPTGISIIEYNFGYGIDHIQKTIGGVRGILDVK